MSEFEHEQWFKSLNANGKTVYFLGNEHKVSKMAWDFQQAKIDEALQELSGLSRFTNEDCIEDFEFLKGAVLSACARIEKALRGEHD